MKIGVGLGIPLQANAGGASVLKIIDYVGLPSPGAYSFMQANSAYAGPVVRVRRLSDNVEQDFGFLSDPDTSAALEAFIGASSGLMVTKYDQSGNGRHLTVAAANAMTMLIDDFGYWFARPSAGKYIRNEGFTGAKTNMSFSHVWRSTKARGLPAMTSPLAGYDFEPGANGFISEQWTGHQSASRYNSERDFDWNDASPRQHLFKWLNGIETAYEYGSKGRDSRVTANPAFSRFSIGKNDFVDATADFYEEVFFEGDADAQKVFDAIKSNYPAMYTIRNLFLNTGDSNTAAGFVILGDQWTARVVQNMATGLPHFSRAIGGVTAKHFVDNPGVLEFYFENFEYTTGTWVCHLGTNDIETNLVTGAQAYANVVTLADRMRAAGATRLVGVTMLARGFMNPSGSAERIAFNNLMIANAGNVFDDIVNTTTNANLQNANDATYFITGDKTHLTSAGQLELANMITAVL